MKADQRRAWVMARISHQCAELGINPKDYLTSFSSEETAILNIAEKQARRVNEEAASL